MKAYLALTFLVLCSYGSIFVCAQNTTVLNQFMGDTTGKGIEGFRLAQSSEQKIVINYYEPIEENELDRLEELIAASLSFYIDHSIVRDQNQYTFKKPRKQLLKDMNDIVENALRFYEFKEIKAFDGFSAQIEDELIRLEQEDFSKLSWAKTSYDTQRLNKLAHEHVQKELRALKDMAIAEVAHFSDENLVSLSGSDTTYTDTRTTEEIIADLTAYDAEALLPIKTYSDDGSSFTVLSVEDNTRLPSLENSGPFNNDLFMQQMLEMMQLNNVEMRAMREEFNEFRDDQLAMWKESENKNNENLQAQIDDLKEMVVDIIRHEAGDDALVSTDPVIVKPNPSNTGGYPANLPRFVNVYFSSGSTQLNAASLLSLNEIVDLLARNPQLNIIITGYADSSGDEMKNLLLSQERSRAVKKFLSQSGLEESRFITKFLGEKDAIESNQLDRRVSLEFVLQ